MNLKKHVYARINPLEKHITTVLNKLFIMSVDVNDNNDTRETRLQPK
jgi:hypothetical protein